MTMKYYSLKNILAKNAQYNIIFGERSNGKTYAVLKYALEQYVKNGKQTALVRRWQEDFVGKRGDVMFNALVDNDEISKLTNGEWTSVRYYASKWYLCKWDETKTRIDDERPFAYGFAISSMEHDKSTSYPDITTILFDEFITRNVYLNDEFVLFLNVISTIVRHRTDVKIFMLGNTVNKYCPYFNEMGLKHIAKMEQGKIDVYEYGDSGLRVAVEYAGTSKRKGKPSDLYFAFDNKKLKMITSGVWEIDIYPHCPVKFKPKDISFTYFIIFDDNVLQCEIVCLENMSFTFIHRKTTPLKDEDHDLIYSTEFDPRPNYKRRITHPTSEIEKRITSYYIKDKVFYQDNDVGEVVRNYLQWSK